MSQLQVTTLESDIVSANVITTGQTTVNSSGMFLGNTGTEYSGSITPTSLVVSESNANYTFSGEFNGTSDSFAGSSATITNFSTYIRLTPTFADCSLVTPVISYYGTSIAKIVIKIRRISGSGWDGSLFYSTAGHGYSESYKMMMQQPTWNGTDWAYIQVDGNRLFAGGNDFITNTITRLRFDFGSTLTDVFEIDYIRFYPVNILRDIVSTPSITINGTNYTSLVSETVNTQIFNVAGANTWTKPSWANTGNELVVVHMWGGGGGGTTGAGSMGGGGGAFVFGYFKASQCNAVCNVVVGAGGSKGTSANGISGNNSIFWSNSTVSLVAYGGGGALNLGSGTHQGGGGGGWISAGISGNGGGPFGGTVGPTGTVSTFGGGGGANNSSPFDGGASVYGGGGGGGVDGGISVYGGGGGGGGSLVSPLGGNSIFGGKGGSGGEDGLIPGGGGGANSTASGNGARGEVRIYTYRILA